MLAQLGADDVDLFSAPQPELLELVSGIKAERGGRHVLLAEHGIRSMQRLALSGFGGGLVVALWPAELKPQAEYLYGRQLATPMIIRATASGWTVEPSPHLAFRNAAPAQRLYMHPALGASEYALRWERDDLERVGQYESAEVRQVLWPWLKSRGYAEGDDDATLEVFLHRHLGARPAYLRPGLRMKRVLAYETIVEMGGLNEVAAGIRDDVNGILEAADEPPLRAQTSPARA